LNSGAASGIAASGASFHDFWCYLRFSLEKPPAGSQTASGKGGWYTTQGDVRVELFFHYALKAIDNALKAFGSEKSGFAISRVRLDFVLVDEPVEHIWVNPVLFRKRRGAD